MISLEKENSNKAIYWIIISISVLLGTLIRFKGLGTWSLALDEYYIIKSSEYIVEHGIPQFPNGGYYLRGILLQYMIAPLLSFGVQAELAGRIFTVIANLITIPAIYLVAKKVGNQLIATVVVVIFCFSIWEIEFARFARMYTPFQAIFMWYIYFALIDYSNNNFKNYKWMILLSAISSFVYEGSIFLAVFNFVPFIVNKKFNVNYIFLALVTFFSSAFVNLFDFRTLHSRPIFPPEYLDAIKSYLFTSPIKVPKILALFAFDGVISSILTLLFFMLNIFLIYRIIISLRKKDFWIITSILLLSIFAFLNQFGLFLLAFIVLVFWNLLKLSYLGKKPIIYLGILFSSNLFYWFGYGILSDNWYSLFSDFSSYSIWGISKRLFVGFANYPDNYYSILNYFKALPFLTAIAILVGSSIIIYLIIQRDKEKLLKYIIGSLIFVCLLATIPTLLYQETRYTFFAAPLLIITIIFAFYLFSFKIFKTKKIVALAFFIFISLSSFIASNDFNFYHLANIDKKDVNYRMIYNHQIKKHLYRRWDIATPVNYVKNNMQEDDIIIINENSQEYYLPKVDYFSFDYRHSGFPALSVNEGEKERWSNSILLNNNEDLLNVLENRKTSIWLIVFPEFWLDEINLYTKYADFLEYKGIDGLVKVFKFPKPTNKFSTAD